MHMDILSISFFTVSLSNGVPATETFHSFTVTRSKSRTAANLGHFSAGQSITQPSHLTPSNLELCRKLKHS